MLQFEKVKVEEIKVAPKELPKEAPKELPKEALKEKPPTMKEPPSPKESTPPVPAPKPTQRHSGEHGNPDVAEKPAVAQKPRFPVAAPRTIMADSPPEKRLSEERSKPVVPERPVIPERPASLKDSFKARSSDNLDEATPKLLEPSSPLSLGKIISGTNVKPYLNCKNLQEVPHLNYYLRTKKLVITCLLLNQRTTNFLSLTEPVKSCLKCWSCNIK